MIVISLFLILVVLPAAVGYLLYRQGFWIDLDPDSHHTLSRFWRDGLQPGDYVIYRKPKISQHPTHRARNVHASAEGEYSYEVDKYWTVAEVLEDGEIVAVTRSGKRVQLQPQDEHLRKAGLKDQVLHWNRFPSV